MSFPKGMLAALFGILGPWAPFWIALADSSFVPLAQAVDVMVVAQALLSRDQAYGTAAMAVAGSTLGCFAAYLAARRAGPRLLERYLAPARRQALQESFARHGGWHLALQTMVPLPLPMRLSLVGAGAFRMHPARFLAAILIARTIRYFGLALATLTFGERAILFWRERAGALASLLVAGIAVWLAWKTFTAVRTARQRRRPRATQQAASSLEQATLRCDEQSVQKLGQAHASSTPAHPAAPARVPHGGSEPRLGPPPHPRPPDSGSPLQSRLHLLQRV
jgi:membrane protein YqaA with SNARE-associated domain